MSKQLDKLVNKANFFEKAAKLGDRKAVLKSLAKDSDTDGSIKKFQEDLQTVLDSENAQYSPRVEPTGDYYDAGTQAAMKAYQGLFGRFPTSVSRDGALGVADQAANVRAGKPAEWVSSLSGYEAETKSFRPDANPNRLPSLPSKEDTRSTGVGQQVVDGDYWKLQ